VAGVISFIDAIAEWLGENVSVPGGHKDKYEWMLRRRWWQRQLEVNGWLPCARDCGEPILPGQRWHLDHIGDPNDDSQTRPSHAPCNIRAGVLVAAAKYNQRQVAQAQARRLAEQPEWGDSENSSELDDDRRARQATIESNFFDSSEHRTSTSRTRSLPEVDVVGLTSGAAQRCSWLVDLARTAGEWAWPRLMTGIHPRAAGSYGTKAIAEIEAAAGRPLWPGQALVILRALEHDAAGVLVWKRVGVSEPRQQGKSTIVGHVAWWRLCSGVLFGEPGDVLHVARDVGAAVNVQRPHRLRAEREPERFKVRSAGGRLEIEHLGDGGRWLLRSSDGVYSYSAVMAIADEAWDLPSSVVDDALAPVLLQRESPQLWVVSTANVKATSLMLGLRAQAIAELDDPQSMLWVEWSANPDDDVGDPAVWRSVCPRWTPEIAERYEELYASAAARRPSDPVADDPVDGFARQYLNVWPSTVEPVRRGEPLADMDAWAACEEDHTPPEGGAIVLVLEEHWDRGVSLVLVAELSDYRFYVQAWQFATRVEAFATAIVFCGKRRLHQVLVGATFVHDPLAVELGATPVGTRELPPAIATFRELLGDDKIRHYASQLLTEQLAAARVAASLSGQPVLQTDRGARMDTLKAALWGLYSMSTTPPAQAKVW
jgi:phage terminase large subunit-like protein